MKNKEHSQLSTTDSPSVPPGYKQTEVGVIPEDWDAVDLDNVCTMKSGEGITSKKIDNYSPYPCYGGNGLRGFTTRYTHDGSFALIGRQGALCGNVVPAEGQFFASEHAVVVTARQGVDIRWLTYVLGRMHLNRYSESSAQPGLSVSKVLKLPLAFPPVESEQSAIASALSDVDALLDGLDRLIAKKHDLKQAAMQQLLTGKTRLPGFEGEWEKTELGQLVAFLSGGTPSRSNETYWNGDVPWISATTLRTFYIWRSESNVTKEAVAASSKMAPIGATLLLVRGSALHNEILAGLVTKPVCFNQDVKALLPKATVFPKFLTFLLHGKASDLLKLVSSAGNTAGVLDTKILKAFEVWLPPKEEQEAISAVLSDMDAEISALEQRRNKTKNIKQAMMQELLTGKTRLI